MLVNASLSNSGRLWVATMMLTVLFIPSMYPPIFYVNGARPCNSL
jgi:hypothetical protein